MPEFIDWAEVRDVEVVLRRAMGLLDVGGWLVVPTENGPALAARADRAEMPRDLPANPLRWTLALADDNDPAEWGGELPAEVRRLTRRAWPGPLILDVAGAAQSGPAVKLPGAVRQLIAPDGDLPLRRPAHDAILNILAIIDGPLVLGEPTENAREWLAGLGEAIDLVIEGGRPPFDEPPTRLRIDGGTWTIAAPGAYGEVELRRLMACFVLFVCTGNTCRSPMAEALFKVMLAERLGCAVAELPERGYWVMSAGVSAMAGGPAAAEAIEIVAASGGDLSLHESRPVRSELVAVADHLIAMTESHRQMLCDRFPDLGCEPRLLCGEEDLPDPIGGDRAIYESCADVIRAHLAGLVTEVTTS